jgi:hypothetical protein
MKLGSILALICSIAATAYASNATFFRKPVKGGIGRGKSHDDSAFKGYSGVVIVIDGVSSKAGASNDMVTKCLVNAFNTVHKHAHDDYELSNTFLIKSVVVPYIINNTTDEELIAFSNVGDVRAAKKKKKKTLIKTSNGARLAMSVVSAVPTPLMAATCPTRAFSTNYMPRRMATCTRPFKPSFATHSLLRVMRLWPR